MRKIYCTGRTLLMAVLAAGLLAMGCGKKTAHVTAKGSAIPTGTLTDGRDGQTYKTVTIGDQTWMAENLNYMTENGSWCYDDKDSNCQKYGRLYDWNAAAAACPAGWKLPDTSDWHRLMAAVGGNDEEGKKLKSKSGWIKDDDGKNGDGNGTDEYGFSALPGGSRLDDGFDLIGASGVWWTVTEVGDENAYYCSVGSSFDYVAEHIPNKRFAISVRCVKE